MSTTIGATTAATTSTAAADAAMKQSTGLNKDDFLKLFITQLQNQDPLNPQDSSQFVGQMAQLTQVEQAYNTNTNLQSLISAVNSTAAMNSSSYIGKSIMGSGNSLYSTGTGSSVAFNLPVATTATSVTVSDASGKAVRTFSLGASASGDNFTKWDGNDDNGAALPAGVYTFSVAGKGTDGTTIAGTTYTTGTVDSISIQGGNPVLQIGPLQVPISSVTMIG